MRITDLLKESGIQLNGTADSKLDAISKMVDLMTQTGVVNDKEAYQKEVLAREESGSTGVGEGIAIPHAKTAAVSKPGLAAMVLKDGVDYDSVDGQPVQLIFLIAAPDTKENVHVDVLSRLSVLLVDEAFKTNLLAAASKEDFLNVIDAAETAKFAEEDAKAAAPAKRDGYALLGVTACPTGIAHTFMAAESLEKAAEAQGVQMKVETNGSGGVKNKLTAAEIEAADCIIVAADKDVEMARFNGKPVIIVKVSDGIHKAEELVTRALSGSVPAYHAANDAGESADDGAKDSVGRSIYKALMNGVSHMLPFVIGGGILIALAFLFDGANAGTDAFGSGNNLSFFLKKVGDLAFGVMFPILAGYIAMAIGDRPALMPGMVGGFIASSGLSVFLPQDEWSASGFFGALIAGFLAGYFVKGMKKVCDKLPKALEGTKPVLIYPVVGILFVGAVMVFVVNPPVGAFNNWLNGVLTSMGDGSKVLLGLVLGGMMAIDFGGPFNKAAYVFGTASIGMGQPQIMAAVMIGGMVPPIAIALATTFFKKKFTKSERNTTLTNYIMGLSFITEGAIPFAASDPIRVIPSCVAGSAVAGGLSMLFNCASPAPHGGIFVIALVENWPLYLVALAAGSIVTMLLLGILKKPVKEK